MFPVKSILLMLSLADFAAGIGGCGQTGPLVLPDADANANPKAQAQAQANTAPANRPENTNE